MMETQIQWDLDLDEQHTTSAFMQLSQPYGASGDDDPVYVGKRWAGMRYRTAGGLAIRLISEAHRLTALAAAKKVIDGGFAPENFTLSTVLETVQPKVGNREEIFPVAQEMGTLEYHQLAEACAIDLLRSVRAGRHLLTDRGPFSGYSEPQLSGIAVPVTVLGVAALAALAYWGAEHSEDVASVEVEKAWAAARAYSEIKVAQAELAAGRKPQLSDWGQARLRTARLQTSGWFPYAAIGLGGVLVAAAAYLGRDKLPGRSTSTTVRENPSRPRRRKRSKSARSCSNPSRAEFIGEARAGGASAAQADRLWRGYLAAQRSRAGRRGGKARSRRRNPAAGQTRAPAALPGKPTSPARSSVSSSKQRAVKRPAAPKPLGPSGSPSSPKRGRRAKPSAKRSAKAARPAARRSAPKRAKRSPKRAKR